MLVLHRGSDDPRRGGGHERLAKPLGEGGCDLEIIVAFLFDRGAAGIFDLGDGFGSVEEIDLHAVAQAAQHFEIAGIRPQIRDAGAFTVSAEAAHAMLHVGKETLARLLAVIADVDAGFDLPSDHAAGRFVDDALHRGAVNGFAAAEPSEHFAESFGPRQAAGMGGEDAFFGAKHRAGPRVTGLVVASLQRRLQSHKSSRRARRIVCKFRLRLSARISTAQRRRCTAATETKDSERKTRLLSNNRSLTDRKGSQRTPNDPALD